MMNAHSKKLGLALGGGGVLGLAHIPALETIDACGTRLTGIAGTSMGAIIAALYASGKSGTQIRDIFEEHIVAKGDGLKELYAKKNSLLKWLDAVRFSWKSSGLLNADGFLRHLVEEMEATRFEDLEVPLQVVATDYYSGESIVFASGPLIPALKASMSIPGVFVPVEHDGRILVDGGVTNNLPYNVLQPQCDLTIAVDVSPKRGMKATKPPSMFEATLGMFDILVGRVTKAMIADHPPDIYFNPGLAGISILEFDKAEEALQQAEASMPELKAKLEHALELT